MLSYTDILQKYWGHASFRSLQEEIVRSVADAKQDTIALLPTGGGKSVCFQVPALAMDGICLVISPLIALMNDQVENLKQRGIKAYALAGKLQRNEIDRILEECVAGQVKFLYLSPERLKSEILQERIRRMKVNLLAIDEAHCVSQWGYDFRPDYLTIHEIRALIPDVPCLALTASATSRVIEDIADKLKLKDHAVFRKSFFRDNLSLFVVNSEKKADYLLKVVYKNPGSGLVYVSSRKDAKVVADLLVNNGVKADHYHAGLPAVERARKQQLWIADQIRVMVCTNAFGMGIDKANVRFVIHWGISSSLEAYYQEAGRAGRDGDRSFAVALVNQSDMVRLEASVDEAFPDKELIKSIYSLLGSYFKTAYGSGEGLFRDFDLGDFAKYVKQPAKTVFHALEILKNDGFIQMSEAFFQPARVMFMMNDRRLYEFQVFNPKFEALLKIILRSYAGLFDDYVKIDEWMLAKKLSVTVESVRAALKHLDQLQVLTYIEQSDKPQIAFATERLQENNFRISKAAYEERKEVISAQVDSVLNYTSDKDSCRFGVICSYFDEPDTQRCGHCDNCLEYAKGEQLDREEVVKRICALLSSSQLSLDELKQHPELRFHTVMVDEAIGWLLGQEKILMNEQGLFSLK